MNPKTLLLTGQPGIGKTTVCRRVIESFEGPCSGFVTGEIRNDGKRIGFEIKLLDGRTLTLSHTSFDEPTVGRYGVNPDVMDNVTDHLLSAINKPETNCIIIDEIGKMELLNDTFKNSIERVLQSPTPILATVPISGPAPVPEIKQTYPLLKVTKNNRDQLPDQIINRLTGSE